jgi:hypothetical protein
MQVKKFENFSLELKIVMVIMSHLSDIQDGFNSMDSNELNNRINFIKSLLLKYHDTNTEINPDIEWEEFTKTRFYKQ